MLSGCQMPPFSIYEGRNWQNLCFEGKGYGKKQKTGYALKKEKGCAELNANTNLIKECQINHKAFHQFFNIFSSHVAEKTLSQITKQSQNLSSLRISALPSPFSQFSEVNECIWHTFVGALPRRTELCFCFSFTADVKKKTRQTRTWLPNKKGFYWLRVKMTHLCVQLD